MFGHQDDQQILNDQAAAWDNNNQQSTQTTDQPSEDNSDNNEDTMSTAVNDTKTAPQTDDAISSTPTINTTDDLLSIKQQALAQLSPIVNHLDQTPEERFRTTMMMIQASDNQSLISEAYQAAQQISDEKLKAQALLDIVNEINYFTHPQQS